MSDVSLPSVASPWIVVPLVATGRAGLDLLTGRLSGAPVDAVEWRVDGFCGDLACGLEAARRPGLPVLATLRTELTGWTGDYAATVRELLALGPDLLDVEAARPGAADLVAEATAAGIVPVVSEHLDHMPSSPARHLARLRALARPEGVAKLAVAAGEDDLDALATAGTAAAAYGPVIVVAMGQEGVATRLNPARFGSCMTFATAGPASAPGQLPLSMAAAALGRR